jgi:hypothetical protein
VATPALRTRVLLGTGVGLFALLVLLASTGPNPEAEFTGSIRRMGGPCLRLEQWGLFGWSTIGQTESLTQAITGEWQTPSEDLECQDIGDSLILVRMPLNAPPDSYQICGLADDRACLTFDLVPFRSDTPGP